MNNLCCNLKILGLTNTFFHRVLILSAHLIKALDILFLNYFRKADANSVIVQ